MSAPMTMRQRQVLEFICGYQAQHHLPPTIREIGKHFGIRSTNGVRDHLVALVERGHLAHYPGRSRGYAPVARKKRVEEQGLRAACGLALQHLGAGNAQAASSVLRTALESFPERPQSE